jgi:hypothetical protein
MSEYISTNQKICKFKSCERDVSSKGYCGGHYQQFRKGKKLEWARKIIALYGDYNDDD